MTSQSLLPVSHDPVKREQNSQMLIDLARLPVLPQQPTQNSLSPHPLNFCWHTRLRGTLPLTRASVTTLTLGGKELLCARAGVDGGGLDDNASVLNELLDMDAGVGVADLRLLSGVKPNFTLADACDGRGEPLL